ncbi:membrane protein [Clostridium polyendosporum]|uniref:Membrane protein n=1 Tax=Clostridium polyendosporum TaxID=69208 RepID=A0A919S0L5_9CLOT|nr:YybS family protein [Clostridium polyendosporum]GIM28960.1 membrane protein [Clostridium polyendosporum]
MKKSKYTTISIVEAGLMSIIIFLLMMMTSFVPVLGMVGMFLLPLPITLLYLRYNKAVAFLAIMVSAILIAIFNNPITAIGLAALYGFSGIAMGYSISRKMKALKIIGIVFMSNLIGILIDYGLYVYVTLGISLTSLIQQIVDSIKQSINIYKSMGLDTSNNPAYQALEQLDVHTILTILPSAIIVSVFMLSLINYVITKSILSRFKYEIDSIPHFTKWYLDNRVGAVLIILVCIGIILNSKHILIGEYIFYSSLSLFQFVIMFIGLSISAYFLKYRFNISNKIIIVICIFLFFSQLSMILFYLGLLDMLFDIRAIDPNSLGNALRNKFKKK